MKRNLVVFGVAVIALSFLAGCAEDSRRHWWNYHQWNHSSDDRHDDKHHDEQHTDKGDEKR